MKPFWKKLALNALPVLLIFPLQMLAAQQKVAPKLVLKSIHQLSAQESKDELYLLIADLDAKNNRFYTMPGKGGYLQEPKSPQPSGRHLMAHHKYWREQDLNKVKNLTIWQRTLGEKDSTQVMVSLIEADAPPWDLDDTLGTVKLNIVHHKDMYIMKMAPFSHANIIGHKRLKNGMQYKVKIKNKKAQYVMVLNLINR